MSSVYFEKISMPDGSLSKRDRYSQHLNFSVCYFHFLQLFFLFPSSFDFPFLVIWGHSFITAVNLWMHTQTLLKLDLSSCTSLLPCRNSCLPSSLLVHFLFSSVFWRYLFHGVFNLFNLTAKVTPRAFYQRQKKHWVVKQRTFNLHCCEDDSALPYQHLTLAWGWAGLTAVLFPLTWWSHVCQDAVACRALVSDGQAPKRSTDHLPM